MPWSGWRGREEFTGWIVGVGTDSGHRVVIGHWPSFLNATPRASNGGPSLPSLMF
jgi:hypothetical protein